MWGEYDISKSIQEQIDRFNQDINMGQVKINKDNE